MQFKWPGKHAWNVCDFWEDATEITQVDIFFFLRSNWEFFHMQKGEKKKPSLDKFILTLLDIFSPLFCEPSCENQLILLFLKLL